MSIRFATSEAPVVHLYTANEDYVQMVVESTKAQKDVFYFAIHAKH